VDPVVVESVFPTSGPRTGLTMLTITGANFTDTHEITVFFTNGSMQSSTPGVFVDSNTITCISPTFPIQSLCKIQVALNGQQLSETSASFLYTGMRSINSSIVLFI